MIESLKKEVLLANRANFDQLALKIFRFQSENCQPYFEFLNHLSINIDSINSVDKIPFLPISFFKTQIVLGKNSLAETAFESSGTTGSNTSRHYVSDLAYYEEISLKIFENSYGSIENYHIIAMLPSYTERGNSSLVYMISNFIAKSKSAQSGFYKADIEGIIQLFNQLKSDKNNRKKILLWGVTFAVLELAESGYDFSDLKDRLIVLETGGMKGRKKELIREELYERLKSGFSLNEIHSEYGMTELLSQAYSFDGGLFHSPYSMKIVLREINDPFAFLSQNSVKKTGGINVIDLANIESCSFIETNDLGQYGEEENTFKVLGRFDNSDVRGCNLLQF
ncbi:MAG: acyl transferase [Bacteroidota bacterium]